MHKDSTGNMLTGAGEIIIENTRDSVGHGCVASYLAMSSSLRFAPNSRMAYSSGATVAGTQSKPLILNQVIMLDRIVVRHW